MKHLFAIALGLSAVASGARAQPMGMPPCPGHPAVVRISKLSPTGTPSGMAQAAQDHQAWYASHGQPNVKVLLASVGASEFITMTIGNPDDAPRPPADDAWRAFVKEYDQNSIIEWTGLTCLTDGEAKTKAAMAGK
jgi:hypothetical protein